MNPAVQKTIPLVTLIDKARKLYVDTYGGEPQWMAAAPGRVNLIGEHTDYNDGYVLPMAIERYVVMAAGRPRAGSSEQAQFVSDAFGAPVRVDFHRSATKRAESWGVFPQGVLKLLTDDGYEIGPLEVAVCSSVPVAAGLSSSAAMEVATATLVEAVTAKPLDPRHKAQLCQQSENQFVGVPCGIMDQFSSALCQQDHLILLDCRTLEVRQVPMNDPQVTVLIINSNVKRELSGSEYGARRKQCEEGALRLGIPALRDANLPDVDAAREHLGDVIYRRVRHIVTENQRVLETARATADNDWETAGGFMYASHRSLRDDYEVSCRELDLLVELARELGGQGVYGSRLTGAGFGGCTVTLVRAEAVQRVAEAITTRYRAETGVDALAFTTRPSQGAQIL